MPSAIVRAMAWPVDAEPGFTACAPVLRPIQVAGTYVRPLDVIAWLLAWPVPCHAKLQQWRSITLAFVPCAGIKL